MIYERKIDKEIIMKELGIRITNPEYAIKERKPLKNRWMLFLLKLYKQHRSLLSKLLKEDDYTKMVLDEDGYSTVKERINDNAAHQQINRFTQKEETPFIKPKYIYISEIVPKEYISVLEKSVSKFLKRYQKAGIAFDTNYEFIGRINDIHCQSLITAFSIRHDTNLGVYFRECEITVETISESFIKVNFQFFLTDEIQQLYNELLIKQINPYYYYGDFKYMRIMDFRKCRLSKMFEDAYKKYLVTVFNKEIKYGARKAIHKDFKYVLSKNGSNSFCAFFFLETNIDKHSKSNANFWNAIDICPQGCFFNDDTDSCIKFEQDIFCIYRRNPSYDTSIFWHDICEGFGDYISYENLKHTTEEHITTIYKWMKNSESSGLEIWLQLMSEMEKRVGYIRRCYGEVNYKWNTHWRFKDLKGNYIEDRISNIELNKEIEYAQKGLNVLKTSVSEKVEMKNTVSSTSIQLNTFVTNFFSAIFALIAIVISLLSKDITNVLLSAFISSEVTKKLCMGALSLVLAWCLYKILNRIHDFVATIFRFK